MNDSLEILSRAPEIQLAHGAGGRSTRDLIRESFLPAFTHPALLELGDSALLPPLPEGRLAFTTDAFVVDPAIFPGGDLGRLSVCGSVNDLAVSGALPLWLSWALILEEGLPRPTLDRFVDSARSCAEEAGISIVTGDTKVVQHGKGDGAFVCSAGIGVVPPSRELSDRRIQAGDSILVSGPIGDHGATVLACRHGIEGGELRSDCAPVTPLCQALYAADVEVRVMHDPTRGGVATTCNESAEHCALPMLLEEEALPIRPEVRAVCELLGMDPLYLACEGRVLAWVPADQSETALRAWHALPQGRDAARIGVVRPASATCIPLCLHTTFGGERPLDMLSGNDLPRIC